MLRRVSVLLVLGLLATNVSATTIERDPTKTKRSRRAVSDPAWQVVGLHGSRRQNDHLARVVPSMGSGSGYINRTGQIVIKPQFETGLSFSEGLAVVWKNDQSSYIDTSGAIVLTTLMKARWSFSDGLTVIGEYPDRVYVDKRGKTVAPYEVGSEF